MTTTLVIRALEMARRSGLIVPGSIFHSDHGTQYRSRKFAKYCGRHGIHRSMGAKMQCWDNAAAETFFSKLKNERLSFLTFTTRAAAKAEIVDYIEHFNNVRLHQCLDYQTPAWKLAEMTRRRPHNGNTGHPPKSTGHPTGSSVPGDWSVPGFGHSISHSHRRTKRRFDPNVQKKTYYVPSLGRSIKLNVSAKGIKVIDARGIESVVKDLLAKGVKL